MQHNKVNYNKILCHLIGIQSYSSACFLFGSLGVKSLHELLRAKQYSLMKRVDDSSYPFTGNVIMSEAFLKSQTRHH